MAKIFKPRRASCDNIKSGGSKQNIVLENGELMIGKVTQSDNNSRYNVYIGNGSSAIKNLNPAIYGDGSAEPMKSVVTPSTATVKTTSDALKIVKAGNTFGQTIGALKRAIELYRVEQYQWDFVPNPPASIPTMPAFFINDFQNFETPTQDNPAIPVDDPETGSKIVIRLDKENEQLYPETYNRKYLDLSAIKDDYVELSIKATFNISAKEQIVLPFSIPKEKIYPLIKNPTTGERYPIQSYRNGYFQNISFIDHSQNGAQIAFQIYRERIYFHWSYLNGNRGQHIDMDPNSRTYGQLIGSATANAYWAFTWKELK